MAERLAYKPEQRGATGILLPVAAVLSTPTWREAVVAAMRHLVPRPAEDWIAIHACATVGELHRSRPTVAVLDLTPRGLSSDRALLLGSSLPDTVFVALVQAGLDRRSDLHAAAIAAYALDAGARALPPAALAETVDIAIAGNVVRRVMEVMQQPLEPGMQAFLERLWVRCWQPTTPREASLLYHRSAATVRRHLARAGLPPLNQLIVWGRLFHAAWLLRAPWRSVGQVAALLDFPSEDALYAQLKRYAGMRPTDVRGGGLETLVHPFPRAGGPLWQSPALHVERESRGGQVGCGPNIELRVNCHRAAGSLPRRLPSTRTKG